MADNSVFSEMEAGNPIFSSIFPNRLSKGDRKKLEIVEVAIRLFGERGPDQITYDDLAEALNTTRSHITYHFRERFDLDMAVIRYMMVHAHEFTFAVLRDALSSRQRLIRAVDGYFDFFVARPEFGAIMLYFYYLAGLPGPFRDLQTQVRAQATERLQELIRQVYAEVGKRAPKHLEALAVLVQNLILGGLILNLATREPVSATKTSLAKEAVVSGIEALLKIKIIYI